MKSFKASKLQRHKSILLLGIILLIAAFFRFYRINEYMTFLGDEGRDVLVVKRMIVDHKFTLLGPITSVGSMYLGPIYYYFMLPFLFIFRLNPVGPAIGIALLALATTYLIYRTGKEFFTEEVGLFASFLYSISPLTITYGRSSWNPNAVPFFAMLLIYSLLNIVIKKKNLWYAVYGLGLGVILQLHYISVIFIPIFVAAMVVYKQKISLKNILMAFLGFIISFSPFLIFELRHDFTNTITLLKFIIGRSGSENFAFTKFIFSFNDVLVRIFWRTVIIVNAEISKLVIFIMGTLLFIYFKKKKYLSDKSFPAFKMMLIWFVVGILSYSFYTGAIYDYYFVPLFPLPFILTAIFLVSIKKYLGNLVYLLILILTVFNLSQSPLWKEPNNMVRNTQEISKFVKDHTGDRPYNFALLTGSNSDHAYRYFLEVWGNPPVTIESPQKDPERKTVMDQLLIVCEDKVCKPLGHPLWEVAGFGQADIAGEWDVSTVKVFRLVHYKGK